MTCGECMKLWCMYYSTKSIAIKDWRLGLLYYLFMFSIFIYIIYNLFSQGSYLSKSPPVAGSVRASVLLNTTGLSVPNYCGNATGSFGGCLYWGPEQFVYPYAGQLNTLFITTRVTMVKTPTPASRNCTDFLQSATNRNCTAPTVKDPANNSTWYYIPWVEYSSIQLDHAVRAELPQSFGTSSYLTASTTQMSGRMLYGCSGNPNKYGGKYGSDYHSATSDDPQLDIMLVSEVIGNATCDGTSFSLEGQSTAVGSKTGETWRSSGAVVSFAIMYTNAGSTGIQDPSSLHYYYIPALVDHTEYKILEESINADGSITYIDRHGILMVFEQTGSIGQFDFFSLLINLVAGLALLQVATTLVEILMLYVLPNRQLYSQVKYEQTIDLTDNQAIYNAITKHKQTTGGGQSNNAKKDDDSSAKSTNKTSAPERPTSPTSTKPPPIQTPSNRTSAINPGTPSNVQYAHSRASSAQPYPSQSAMASPILVQQGYTGSLYQQHVNVAYASNQPGQVVYLPQQPIQGQQQPQYYYQQ